MNARRTHRDHILWTAGDLQCVLVTLPQTHRQTLQLRAGGRTVFLTIVSDADHAAAVAERLWTQFVERA